MSRTTPPGAIARGPLPGAAGTPAMDALPYRCYRRGGGTDTVTVWEFSAGVRNRPDAPAPAPAGRRLVESLFAPTSRGTA